VSEPKPRPLRPPRVVIVDNYDSYTYNLYQRIGEITDVSAHVFRNDKVSIEQIEELEATHLLISPGPGSPEDPAYFGVCRRILLELGPRIPVLGVCLGHQGISSTFGGKIVRAPTPMHGKPSRIHHDGSALYRGLANPIVAMRYHSLVVDPKTMPECLKATAWTDEGLVMGVAHKEFPILGVQFHPESIGTPDGSKILSNFLNSC
jgi:anthranilate synthase/aminodeoxychorismate synthase-like glutamine amidotransferase